MVFRQAFTHADSHTNDHLADLELGSRPEELLHADFSRWPARALRGSETAHGLHIFQPIVLQNLGKRKVPLEYAFKSVLHQLCDAAVGEFTFLECAAPNRIAISRFRQVDAAPNM